MHNEWLELFDMVKIFGRVLSVVRYSIFRMIMMHFLILSLFLIVRINEYDLFIAFFEPLENSCEFDASQGWVFNLTARVRKTFFNIVYFLSLL